MRQGTKFKYLYQLYMCGISYWEGYGYKFMVLSVCP